MSTSFPKTTSGKVYDPVFVFMLAAVILAVGSSFILRAAVTGFGTAPAGVTVDHASSASAQPPIRHRTRDDNR